jgi:catechol 2,3-dioxygenase-like lactoylglutathione lyase family enzyme
MVLDHMILHVNDAAESARFYVEVLGLVDEGAHAPFTQIRVSPDFVLLLGAWGTQGGEHLAFAMPRAEFDAVVRRVRERGIPYGDTFDAVGNMKGPAVEARAGGARGLATSLYFLDPNEHMIEIRRYE